jgi:hypothetical protein
MTLLGRSATLKNIFIVKDLPLLINIVRPGGVISLLIVFSRSRTQSRFYLPSSESTKFDATGSDQRYGPV